VQRHTLSVTAYRAMRASRLTSLVGQQEIDTETRTPHRERSC
jgi:hypothetical protein